MKKGISVVIVTYNRPKDVKETVDSLINQSIKPLEIIVIDDGSNPPLNVKFDVKNLKLIRLDKEVGLSDARNYGTNIAKGEYVAFIDDDAIADKYWLEEIQKGIRIGADILGGPLKPIYEVQPPNWWNEKVLGSVVSVGNIGEIWGANMIIKKEVFNRMGFFKSEIGKQKGKLLSCEETDLINRAKRRGYQILFIPKAIVFHKVKSERMTLKYILNSKYFLGKTMKILYGYKPLKTSSLILKGILEMAYPSIILSEKAVKIRKIASIVALFGELT